MSFSEKSDRKSIFKNPEVLSSEYIPEEFMYRDEEIGIIEDEILFQLNDGLGSNLLVSGQPGTGKTHSLMKICEDGNEHIKENGLNGRILYITVKDRSVYDIFIALNKKFRKYPKSGFAFPQVVMDLAEVVANSEEKVIVIFDEVDKMKETKDTVADNITDLIYHTTRLGANVGKNIDMRVILVTNSPMVRDKIKDFSSSTFQHEHVCFSSYDATQIERILTDRVEEAFLPGIVKENAVRWLSANVTRGYCDLRYGLTALKYAGKNVVRENKDKLTIGDIQDAINRIEYDEVDATVRGLNVVQFAALIALVVRDKQSNAGVGSETLYEMYKDICRKLGSEPRTYSYVRKFIMPRLETQGLVTSRVKGLGRGKGQILIYYVRGLEDMLPVAAEVAKEEYGMVMRVNGQSVLEGY